jgi:hypothetical protein
VNLPADVGEKSKEALKSSAGAVPGTPHALRKQIGHGNGAAMQSMENDETVSHSSHSRLEDADEARVSHIATITATIFFV